MGLKLGADGGQVGSDRFDILPGDVVGLDDALNVLDYCLHLLPGDVGTFEHGDEILIQLEEFGVGQPTVSEVSGWRLSSRRLGVDLEGRIVSKAFGNRRSTETQVGFTQPYQSCDNAALSNDFPCR